MSPISRLSIRQGFPRFQGFHTHLQCVHSRSCIKHEQGSDRIDKTSVNLAVHIFKPVGEVL